MVRGLVGVEGFRGGSVDAFESDSPGFVGLGGKSLDWCVSVCVGWDIRRLRLARVVLLFVRSSVGVRA